MRRKLLADLSAFAEDSVKWVKSLTSELYEMFRKRKQEVNVGRNKVEKCNPSNEQEALKMNLYFDEFH